MKKPEKLTQRPIYLLFLSLFPVLSLLGINIAETAPEEALRSILVSLVLGGGVLLLAYPLFRGWHRAALAAAIFLIIFFSYGHVYNLIKQIALGEMLLGRHRFLGPLGFVLLLAGWWWVKTLADPGTYSRTLNLFAALLLVYPILQISPALVQSLRTALAGQENRLEERPLVSPGDLPDIYYIIPDAYTRDDTLLDFYQYDNSPFLEELEARGFYIARCSQSNYARTYLSLSSSLNMDYVQTLSPQNDSERLTKLIKRSRVRQTLESLGYTMVAFDAGYFRTQWPDADIYVSVKDDPTRSSAGLLGFNEFETILVETTALRFLLDGNLALGGELLEFVYESGRLERYNRTQYLLDNLSAVAAVPGPKFVFAHLPAPHEPYIFSPTGEFIPDQEAYIPGYPDQVAYINSRLLEAVDVILGSSETPPIIILQGDHGGFETKADFRRLHILNAYYLPGGAEPLYPAITPVNTFRLIFDEYFGEDLGLLPDVSYYSTSDKNYQFSVAPVDREGCK